MHGLGGTYNDMLNFKNYILLVNPNAEFLISNKNSAGNSDLDINILASNLISEIESEIEYNGFENIEKISFVGFSLGGIIIRAALPLLSKYKSKFYGYISLASPHLGLKLNKKVIAAGIWFMRVFQGSK